MSEQGSTGVVPPVTNLNDLRERMVVKIETPISIAIGTYGGLIVNIIHIGQWVVRIWRHISEDVR